MGSKESGRRPLLKLLVIGCCVTVAVVAMLLYNAYSTRKECDKAASADMEKVLASLERLGNEIVDLDCPLDEMMPHVKVQFR